MSRLSVHISSGTRTGFGTWLAKAKPAVVYSVNDNVRGDFAANSPNTKLILRRQTDTFNRLPNDMFIGDPAANATNWLIGITDSADRNRTQMQNILLNNPDWADVLNEPVPDTVDKARWLNTWMLTALEVANSNGVKLALFSFPTGFSKDPLIWNELVPAMRRGKQLGAILSLHAYWSSDPSLDYDNALRYRDIWAILPEDAKIPIVISEASNGNGYNTGLSGQAWVNDMALYDLELMKDPYILSACGYQLGGNESNLYPALGAYGDYIAANPTEVDMPRTQYKRIYVLIHPSLSGKGYYPIAEKHNNTAGPSADDAGLGDLVDKEVVVVNASLWGGDAAMKNFFNTYYPGTTYFSVVCNTPADLDNYLNTLPK